MTSTTTAPAVGDVVTGRCVTNGTAYTGRVAEVIEPVPYSGAYGPVYRVVDTGQRYGNGKPIEPILEAVTVVADPIPLIVRDAGGVEFHASDEHGDRLSQFSAQLVGQDVRYRRQFRVSFPRYSRGPAIRAAVAAALLPHERVVSLPMEHWGADDVAVTTELIFPSSSWCVDCSRDVRPDRYGRTWPCAVSITPAATHRSYTLRNYPHQDAHELAAREIAKGNEASVGVDGCG